MAEKTVILDEEAYEILVRRKREGQSLSEVVKEQLGEPKRGTAGYLLQNAKKYALSEETLDAVEEQIRARSDSPVRLVKP